MTGITTSSALLKGIVAYVDVWSASRMEDYSDPFIEQLLHMGAEVSKTFNKQVTHVIFKHGRPSTWRKAQKIGVRIVSVHWVARCKETNQRVNEELFPAQNEELKLHLLNKRTHRCMQPRDIAIKTPENDRRLKLKMDKMAEGLVSSSPVVSDTSPFIIDEESGIVYSPSLKRSASMAQRLKEMRAEREHLSPSASQMQGIGSEYDSSSPPASTTLSFLQKLEEEPLDCFSVSHCHSSKKIDEREKLNHSKKSKTETSSKQVNRKPPESDRAMAMCNLVSIEPLSSGSKQCSVSKIRRKKTTLESFIYETCSETKEGSNLKPEAEDTGISTDLRGSLERPKSSFPKSLTNTNRRNSASILPTNSKCFYSSKSSTASRCFTEKECVIQKDESLIDKPRHKGQCLPSAELHSADSVCVSPSREVVNGELFEDFFSPANNAFKQRVVLFGLTSNRMHMPTFDLEDSNKKSKTKFNKKQKHDTTDIKDLLVRSSGSLDAMEETVAEPSESSSKHVVAGKRKLLESSRFEEIKLEPSPKKQRTYTGCRNSSAVLSEKRLKSSVKRNTAKDKKNSK